MIDEVKKSINSTIYERAKSPLYGTLVVSWVIWNWRIFYVTFFIDKKVIPNKLDYINDFLYKQENLIWYPLLSTFILLTIIPFISNGAFYLDLKFKKWRIDQRNEIEKKQLLTVEQSILIREQLKNKEERFQKITDEKDQEIKLLQLELQEATKKPEEKIITVNPPKEKEPSEIDILYKKIQAKGYVQDLLSVGKMVNKGEWISNEHIQTNFFIELGLLKHKSSSANSRTYTLTADGEAVLKKARLSE